MESMEDMLQQLANEQATGQTRQIVRREACEVLEEVMAFHLDEAHMHRKAYQKARQVLRELNQHVWIAARPEWEEA